MHGTLTSGVAGLVVGVPGPGIPITMLKLPPLNRNLPAALRDATHPKESVRLSAIVDLGLLAQDSPTATGVLETALIADASAEVRRAAAVALADGASCGSVEPLLAAARDSDARVRQMALLALGELGGPEHPDVAVTLREALDDPLPALRFQALGALVGLDVEADAAIEWGLRDSDPQVRLLSLRLLNDRAQHGALPVGAAASWQHLVREHLEGQSPTVRLAAALVLHGLGDVEAEATVCSLLNAPKTKLDVEEELRAIERVGRSGLRGAVPGLRRRAAGAWWSPTLMQWPARVALALLGDEHASRQILRGLYAWSWQTRTTAAEAAGAAKLQAAQGRLGELAAQPGAADPQVVEEALRQIALGPTDGGDGL